MSPPLIITRWSSPCYQALLPALLRLGQQRLVSCLSPTSGSTAKRGFHKLKKKSEWKEKATLQKTKWRRPWQNYVQRQADLFWGILDSKKFSLKSGKYILLHNMQRNQVSIQGQTKWKRSHVKDKSKSKINGQCHDDEWLTNCVVPLALDYLVR